MTFNRADSAGPNVPLKKSYSRLAACANCCVGLLCAVCPDWADPLAGAVVYSLMFAWPMTAVGSLNFAATIVPGKPGRSQLNCQTSPPRCACGAPVEPDPKI